MRWRPGTLLLRYNNNHHTTLQSCNISSSFKNYCNVGLILWFKFICTHLYLHSNASTLSIVFHSYHCFSTVIRQGRAAYTNGHTVNLGLFQIRDNCFTHCCLWRPASGDLTWQLRFTRTVMVKSFRRVCLESVDPDSMNECCISNKC